MIRMFKAALTLIGVVGLVKYIVDSFGSISLVNWVRYQYGSRQMRRDVARANQQARYYQGLYMTALANAAFDGDDERMQRIEREIASGNRGAAAILMGATHRVYPAD